jgi:hypothetical protein
MEKLPEDFKQKWTAALRSGDFKQGEGQLYSPTSDTWCCLGVAGSLCGYSKEQLATKIFIGSNDSEYIEPIQEYPIILIRTDASDMALRLANMNDGLEGPKSFSQIADWIDENL